jgi:hypothetical protein
VSADDIRRWLQAGAEPQGGGDRKPPRRPPALSPEDVALGREMAQRRRLARRRRAGRAYDGDGAKGTPPRRPMRPGGLRGRVAPRPSSMTGGTHP